MLEFGLKSVAVLAPATLMGRQQYWRLLWCVAQNCDYSAAVGWQVPVLNALPSYSMADKNFG